MEQFEYMGLRYDEKRGHEFIEALNQHGASGWRVVASLPTTYGCDVVLMRPAQFPQDRPLTYRELAQVFNETKG